MFLVKRETIDDGTCSSMYGNEKIRIWSYLPDIVHSDSCLIAAIGQNNHLPAEQPNSEIDDDDDCCSIIYERIPAKKSKSSGILKII